MKKTIFAWHVHHKVLLELLTELISVRREYIKETKPKEEVPLRLKLLKVVRGKLPKEVVATGEAYLKAEEAYHKAWEAYLKAWEASDKAWEASDKAWEAYLKAWEAYHKAGEASDKAYCKHYKEIEKLHRLECKDCPWDNKKQTIFPKKD